MIAIFHDVPFHCREAIYHNNLVQVISEASKRWKVELFSTQMTAMINLSVFVFLNEIAKSSFFFESKNQLQKNLRGKTNDAKFKEKSICENLENYSTTTKTQTQPVTVIAILFLTLMFSLPFELWLLFESAREINVLNARQEARHHRRALKGWRKCAFDLRDWRCHTMVKL